MWVGRLTSMRGCVLTTWLAQALTAVEAQALTPGGSPLELKTKQLGTADNIVITQFNYIEVHAQQLSRRQISLG